MICPIISLLEFFIYYDPFSHTEVFHQLLEAFLRQFYDTNQGFVNKSRLCLY